MVLSRRWRILLTLLAVLSPWLAGCQGLLGLNDPGKAHHVTPMYRSTVLAECNERHQDGSDLAVADNFFSTLWPPSEHPVSVLTLSWLAPGDFYQAIPTLKNTALPDRGPPQAA